MVRFVSIGGCIPEMIFSRINCFRCIFSCTFFARIFCYLGWLFNNKLRLKLLLFQSSLKQKENYSDNGKIKILFDSKCWVMMFRREKKLSVLKMRMLG